MTPDGLLRIGVFGLAAATALSSVVRTAMLWRALAPEVKPQARDLLREARYSVVPAAVAAGAVWITRHALPHPQPAVGDQLLHFGCAAAAGLIVYVLMSFRRDNTFAKELIEKFRSALAGRRA